MFYKYYCIAYNLYSVVIDICHIVHQVLLSDDQNTVVDRNETQFGTLLPNTLYQVIISAADVNGTNIENILPLEYQFRTGKKQTKGVGKILKSFSYSY